MDCCENYNLVKIEMESQCLSIYLEYFFVFNPKYMAGIFSQIRRGFCGFLGGKVACEIWTSYYERTS
jgi:hypothetical protein